MSRSSVRKGTNAIQYVLDSSAIIRSPEILSFSDQDTDLVILTPVLAELGMYSGHPGRGGLQQLVNRALESGLVRKVEVGFAIPEIRPNMASKGVDTSIVAYVLDQLSRGIQTVCVSLDKDLLIPLRERGAAITPDEFLKVREEKDTSAPAATIGLTKFRRRSMIWLCINIVVSVLSVTATIAAYSHIDELLKYIFVFKWLSGVAFTVAIGVGIYAIRQKYRIQYAVMEITIGVMSVLTSVNVSADFPFKTELDVNTSIKLAGGFYIIVRGLDNLGKGFEGRLPGIYWKRYFG